MRTVRPFTPIPENAPVWSAEGEPEACKALIASIIYQAIYNATLGVIKGHLSCNRDTKREQQKALNYLDNSREFRLHCDILGLNHEAVRQKTYIVFRGENDLL